jgi:hypothetical protein
MLATAIRGERCLSTGILYPATRLGGGGIMVVVMMMFVFFAHEHELVLGSSEN